MTLTNQIARRKYSKPIKPGMFDVQSAKRAENQLRSTMLLLVQAINVEANGTSGNDLRSLLFAGKIQPSPLYCFQIVFFVVSVKDTRSECRDNGMQQGQLFKSC